MTKITNISELTLDDAVGGSRDFDCLIGYVCSERRSIHVLQRSRSRCAKTIFFFEKQIDGSEVPFSKWTKGVSLFEIGVRDDEISAIVENSLIDALRKNDEAYSSLSILIDISSMPRVVMASVMSVLEDISSIRPIDVVVAYCLAKYTPPSEHRPRNKTVKPVHPAFTGFSISPGLPVTAIVGLGYEKGKALGAVEYVESSDHWIFIPTSEEKKYLKKVQLHNKTILALADEEKKFEYSVHSPLLTVARLESLVSILRSTHKTVLLPFGPKIFFLCSLLVAMVHKTCSVWHVTGEQPSAKADVSPSAFVMCLSFNLQSSDDESDFPSVKT